MENIQVHLWELPEKTDEIDKLEADYKIYCNNKRLQDSLSATIGISSAIELVKEVEHDKEFLNILPPEDNLRLKISIGLLLVS